MSREHARYLCINALAGKIWQNVPCALQQRDQEDWRAAEVYIDAHPEIVDRIAGTCWPDSFDERAFEATYGEFIYKKAFLPLKEMGKGGLPKPPYQHIP